MSYPRGVRARSQVLTPRGTSHHAPQTTVRRGTPIESVIEFLGGKSAVRFLLLVFVLIASITPSAAAESDDINLARKLEREAHELCGASCDRWLEFGVLEAKIGDAEASKKSFLDAWTAAAKLEDGPERRMVLSGIATLQAQAGQAKEAIEASQRLTVRFEQAMTFGAIAGVQADAGEEKAALNTVDLIPAEEIRQRSSALAVVAMNLSKRRDFSGAVRVLNRISSDDERAERIIARNVPMEQLSPQERAVIDPVMEKSLTLVFIAEVQAAAGDRKRAHQTALAIRLRRHRDLGLGKVACIAADSGDIPVAEAAIKGIEGREQKCLAQARVVAAMAKLGRFNEARDLLDAIQDAPAKANALFEMAGAHAAHGDAKAARSLVKSATSLEPSAKDAHDAGLALIVTACLKSWNLELGEAFTRDIHDPSTLSEALQAIAVANWRVKRIGEAKRFFDESRQAAENVVGSYYRCARLRELAMSQFESGERVGAMTSVELALAAARKVEIGGGTDVIALTETATTQGLVGDRDGAAASFKIARATAARYPEESYVAQLLQDVAMAQARAGDVEAAIQAARQHTSVLSRSCMLVGVANAILSRSATAP